MINISICDDEIQELERAHGFLTSYMKEHTKYEISIVSFSAPLELFCYVEEHGGFDIYLLDVYMAGMLGTDAARELRKLDANGEIIFLTTSRDHAIDAFEVDASQYLTKPYSQSSFYSALDKVFGRLNIERRHMITLKASEGRVRLFTRDIIFTESGRNNYQIIHTIQGENIEVRMTASTLFDLLSPAKSIIRCGASINLNLRFIRQITKEMIIFDSGDRLAYPYRAYQNLKDEFLRFQMSAEL